MEIMGGKVQELRNIIGRYKTDGVGVGENGAKGTGNKKHKW